MATSAPSVTVITPVYNETDALSDYISTVREVLLSRSDIHYAILFVDDGSNDDSWSKIEKYAKSDSQIDGLRLSRNFGPHAAIAAGIDHVDSDAVTILACDLQDPPEIILEFVEAWQDGAQIVWGQRRTRQDPTWRTAASHFFTVLLERYSSLKSSKFTTGSFLLMDCRVVSAVKQMGENNRITFAIVAWTGFEQRQVPYDRAKRQEGLSKWTFWQMIRTFHDAFIGYSDAPAKMMMMLGLLCFFLSAFFIIYSLIVWFTKETAPGWISTVILMNGFFGLSFLMFSIIGEYLARIYSEVANRPLYFISDATDTKTE